MKEKEILEGNKLIAEFMGATLFLERWRVQDENRKYTVEQPLANFLLMAKNEELKFHTSWDWLMPVVEKIVKYVYEEEEQDGGFGKVIVKHRPHPRTFGMISQEEKFMVRFNRCAMYDADTLIEATWLAVIDFIKWYNQNKTS